MDIRLAQVTFFTALITLGCTSTPAQPGEQGGRCQVGPMQCDEGLTCNSGVCEVADEIVDKPEIKVDFFLELESVPADGKSSFFFELTVTAGPEDEPFEGELFVYPDPVSAGDVAPRPMPIEDGLGLGTYVACNRAVDVECPEFVRLIVTTEDQPLQPFAASAYFQLLGEGMAPTPGRSPLPPEEPSPAEQNSETNGLPEGEEESPSSEDSDEDDEEAEEDEEDARGGTQ